MSDFILLPRKNQSSIKVYKAFCPQCNCDKGYVRKSRINKLCTKCAGKNVGQRNKGKSGPNKGKVFSEETRKKMSSAKLGKPTWNKGLKEQRARVIEKLSAAKKGRKPHNKDIAMSETQKIKLSCVNQGISIEEFDGFQSPKNKLERDKFYALDLHNKCFELNDYTCNKCNKRGGSLHAHHMNSWGFFKEERYDINNLVCLCTSCHKEFHAMFGNGKANPNTKLQYTLYRNPNAVKKQLYVLTGAPAAGKSWVAAQLSNLNVIDSDTVPEKELVKNCESMSRPLLTLTVGVSTFIKNNPQFDIKLIVIAEDETIINDRMISRGGKITDTIKRRIKRMKNLAKQAEFLGTSQQVLDYLQGL